MGVGFVRADVVNGEVGDRLFADLQNVLKFIYNRFSIIPKVGINMRPTRVARIGVGDEAEAFGIRIINHLI